MKPVAIIGGGITGLTAAFRLKQRGIPVMLLEASDRVGGVIQSDAPRRLSGRIRPQQHPGNFARSFPTWCATWVWNRAGIYSDPRAEKRYVVRGKKPVAIPNSAAGFLTTPLFSLPAKLRVLAEPFIWRAPEDVEESIAQFVAAAPGPGISRLRHRSAGGRHLRRRSRKCFP